MCSNVSCFGKFGIHKVCDTYAAVHTYKYFLYRIFSNSSYIVFSYIWYSSKLDTEAERRWTWILVPLFVWPQYQALKLIKRILWKKGHRGDEEDEDREREVIKYRNAAQRSILRITYSFH